MTLSPNAIRLIAHSDKYLNPPKSIWASENGTTINSSEIYCRIQDPQITAQEYTEALRELRLLASKRRHPLKEAIYYPLHARLVDQNLGSVKNSKEYDLLAKTLFHSSLPLKMRYDVKTRLSGRKTSKPLTEKYPMDEHFATAVTHCADEMSEDFKELLEDLEHTLLGDIEGDTDDVIDAPQEDDDSLYEEMLEGAIIEGETEEVLAPEPEAPTSGEISLGGVLFKVAQGSTLKIGKVACGAISSKGLKSLSIDKVEDGVLYGLSVNH